MREGPGTRGHVDRDRADDLRQRFDDGTHGPLALAGDLIEVDTSGAVDIEALLGRLLALNLK